MAPTIVIASDHPAAGALARTIRQARPNAGVYEAGSLRAAAELLRRVRADLVLIDLELTDGGGFASLLVARKIQSAVHILALGTEEEANIVRRARSFGAVGFLSWSAPPLLVRAMVAKALNGQDCWLPDAYLIPARAVKPIEQCGQSLALVSALTPAQLQVLAGIGNGLLNKQIAYELNITEATVKAHLTMIYRKLQVKNRAAAVRMFDVLRVPMFRPDASIKHARTRRVSRRQKIQPDIDSRS